METDEQLEKIKKQMLNKLLSNSGIVREKGILTKGKVSILDANNFNDALNIADKPLLIDFWAQWCSPCKMMEPVLNDLAIAYKEHAYFGKVNVDENVSLAQMYGVRSIPHFLIFKARVPVDRVIGAVGKSILESTLRKYL
jgi:thioredoxin 1